MLTVAFESFIEGLDELKELLPIHWQELALNKDKVPLDPQYNIYFEQENKGQLIYATLREAGNLVGYFIGFIAPGLHYRTCLTCHMDIFYIHPDHRGKRGGLILYKEVEKELIRRGVDRVFVGFKKHMPDAKRLYEVLGYEPCEETYTKWIGE